MISQLEVIGVLKDAVYTVLITAMPMLVAALGIGLLVSIFQATTQINEQTLAFVPKIIGVLLAMLLFGGFILNNLEDFTISLYQNINQMLT
jgi:flagellar biosynthetic protein FliQ